MRMIPLKTFINTAFLLIALPVAVQAQTNVFERYFKTAEAVSRAYPQEKAYLHFDNTSYYQGDTIWFKAHLVNVADNRPSQISKPLYVELLDQLGNRLDRQIIKMENGEGSGCFALTEAFFTGYYEIRAYTRWMLAFDNVPYFTRVLPVFRKMVGSADKARSIARYRSLDKSMKNRPVESDDKFSVKFYPEGGNLVKGLTSIVAFEVAARDSGAVNASGFLCTDTGQRLSMLQALHDGRGSFIYTPGDKPAKAVFEYNGNEHSFKLPAALDRGYVMQAVNRGDNIDLTLTRSSVDMNDTLAVFLFSRGVPVSFTEADFNGGRECRFRFPTADIPEGVTCFTLLNSAGRTLAERFCFISPRQVLDLKAVTDKPIYSPYERINCTVRLVTSGGEPVKNVAVALSIRDGIESDYKEFDNNIMTDLLLTSELRGYIDRPGFYFRDESPRSRMLLDQLLLVRGWRRYDMASLLGQKKPEPRYMPEQELILSGRVKSLLNQPQSNIGVSVIAMKDSTFMAGNTVADGKGYFNIPIDGFKGETKTVIQTRRQGKKYNRWSRVSLFRNYEPETRAYAYREMHPVWKQPLDLTRLFQPADSAIASELLGGSTRLDETYVTAKRKLNKGLRKTEEFERDIIGYYNIRDFINRKLDDGKPAYNLYDILHELNHDITIPLEGGNLRYRAADLVFLVDSKSIGFSHLRDEYMKMQTMLLYRDHANRYINEFDSLTFRRKQVEITNFWTGFEESTDAYSVLASIKMDPDWNIDKRNDPRRGMRITTVRGYEAPREFYSPVYGDVMPVYEDKRRTLYWNPSVMTDSNGEATVSCFNNSTSRQVVVVAETISNGKTGVSLYAPIKN